MDDLPDRAMVMASRIAESVSGKDLDDTLRSLTRAAVEMLPGVDEASISIRHESGALRSHGLTADFLIRHLAARQPASLELATLADKPVRRIVPVQPRYVGLEAPDRFLIGYGLDYLGRYRNLDRLWAVDGSSLAADPDRFVPRLYGERAQPGT